MKAMLSLGLAVGSLVLASSTFVATPAIASPQVEAIESSVLSYWTQDKIEQALRNSGLTAKPAESSSALTNVTVAAEPDRINAVGLVFFTNQEGDPRACTGTALRDEEHNVVMASGGCIHGGQGKGYNSNIAFAPGFANKQTPFGLWEADPKTRTVHGEWRRNSNSLFNQGFFRVKPRNGQELENVVGGNRLAAGQAAEQADVRVHEYQLQDDGSFEPRNAVGAAEDSGGQALFNQPMYNSMTGGPWLINRDPVSGEGEVYAITSSIQGGSFRPEAYPNSTDLRGVLAAVPAVEG